MDAGERIGFQDDIIPVLARRQRGGDGPTLALTRAVQPAAAAAAAAAAFTSCLCRIYHLGLVLKPVVYVYLPMNSHSQTSEQP